MNDSFLGITFVTIFTMILYILVVLRNKVIPKKQNTFFILTAVSIIVIIVFELLTLVLDDSPLKFKWLHFLSNFLGFGAVPLVEYCFGRAIVSDKKKSRWFLILWCVFIGWMISSSIFGYGIFYIDENNHYSRDKGFNFYVFISIIGIIFLFIESFLFVREVQYKGAGVIWLCFGFISLSYYIQVRWPQIHITWLGIAYSVAIYYMYYNDILQQLDSLTGLFNTDNFLVTMSTNKKESVLIVVEIENFSKLRNTYTRNETNKIITAIGKEIKKYYNRYGKCFRLNTHEFCIIVPNTKLNFEVLNKAFFMSYVNSNYKKEELALFTIGYTHFKPKEDVDTVLTRADVSKRMFLEERLHYLYT